MQEKICVAVLTKIKNFFVEDIRKVLLDIMYDGNFFLNGYTNSVNVHRGNCVVRGQNEYTGSYNTIE